MTDLRDLRRTTLGSIVGRIWFADDGDDAFPEPRWSDFVVVVLGWWIKELLDLRKTGRKNGVLLFMDGPYIAGVEASGEIIAVSFLRNEAPVAWMPRTILTPRRELEANLVTVGLELVTACRSRGWSQDVEVQKLARLFGEADQLKFGDESSAS